MNFILLLILGLVGFAISAYIYHQKYKRGPLVCKVGTDCNAVVYSRYGKTFGIENTIGGMIYYSLIIASGIYGLINPSFFEQAYVYWTELAASGGALIFSVYLTYIQFGVLKEWCEYCVASAIVTLIIFVTLIL